MTDTTTNTHSGLAIFDLDNTLLGGDSDYAWGEFLIEQRLVDADEHRRKNDAFYADYQRGELDMHAYLCFVLETIAGKSPVELEELRDLFMQQFIQPMLLPAADDLLKQHRDKNDFLLVITATSRFITEPIARLLGVDDLLASEAEIIDGRYTGKPEGTPCYHTGKVTRLEAWLKDRQFNMEHACFYSDSHNDIPLLEAVGHPVAVDADEKLRAHAEKHGWPVISLRNNDSVDSM